MQVPGLTTPLVYDTAGLFLVVGRDFKADSSFDYAPAFKADGVALRVTGRFGVGVPCVDASMRKVTVSGTMAAQSTRTSST